ncbi:PQQ-binding-like beta-propeller repeat protein [Christensenellaceae bacterium OttesenSCG-928-L17]|nr:PQQ-binding-like beta-propeller repeat protein [Christensenellaceae bacterium OttesenSCG-928-L17]
MSAKRRKTGRIVFLIILTAAVVVAGILAFCSPVNKSDPAQQMGVTSTPPSTDNAPPDNPDFTALATPTPEPTPYYNTPSAHSSALPSVFGYKRELEVDGARTESFARKTPIDFVSAEHYASLPGVLTFRGNNYRDNAAYGTANVQSKKLSLEWTVNSGSMPKGVSGDGSWSGSGWVGQPLVVEWPHETKAIMNMYDWAKEQDGLVEIILATMDGNVYFLELETGKPTRDKLHIGVPFKGAGSLDPRGYPLLYLGSGEMYNDSAKATRALVYSLIDFERLYEFGKQSDSFSLRNWHAYDSAPLVDAATDTLFYPGENGILYSMKLNTNYSPAAGTISVSPTDIVKYRYSADRTGDSKYWLGYESSAAIWGEHLYVADNAGLFQCINVNTMDIVWVQDTWDDTNGSPVLELDPDNHTGYLYVGTSLHWKKDSSDRGDVAFFKLDAVTGEVIWKDVRNVATVSGVSGGIQATAVLGKGNISDLVIIPYARTPRTSRGLLVALDKTSGKERWTFETENYSWSSPIAIYDEQGTAYIVQADTYGRIYLLDGATGALLDTLYIEKNNFEASPVAFNDTIVIGSRASRIYGIKIK